MDNDDSSPRAGPLPSNPHALTPADFAELGVEHFAYVKGVDVEGEAAFAVYAADGRLLATLDGRDTAVAVIRHNNLEPLSVH
jgi:hypothetical protein